MDIFEKIKELQLPQGSYVIVAGGVLVALGILDWDEDIDLSVSPEIFNELMDRGWKQEKWQDKTVLKHGVYDVGVGFDKWSIEDLLSDAVTIEGIPFMSLGKLLEWKTQMGREKDKRHVELIIDYMARTS